MQLRTSFCMTVCGWLLAAPALAQPAAATAGYPDKPIRVIVPVAAGGGTDITSKTTISKKSTRAARSRRRVQSRFNTLTCMCEERTVRAQ
jgi:tripartite-type tricarboxylate transporter receptor subunit TctC